MTLIRTDWQENPGGDNPASDFRMLYSVGKMVSEGDGADVYDPTSLAEGIKQLDPDSDPDTSPGGFAYRYPPPFAQLLSVLSPLAYSTALIGWVVAGLFALSASLWLLLGRSSVGLLFLSVASVPAWMTLRLGQAAFFWLLILTVAFVLGERRMYMAAGAVAGLLVLKPTLLAALVVLLLVQARRFIRVLGGVAATIAGIFAFSFIADPEMWTAYVSAPLNVVDDMAVAGFLKNAFSAPDSLILVGLPIVVAWGAGAAIIVATAAFMWRRVEPSWFNIVVVAVPLTLLAVPRMFVYEWMLLAVPLVALWRRYPHHRDHVWLAAGLLSFTSLISPALTTRMIGAWGVGFQLATLSLALLLVGTLLGLSRDRSQHPIAPIGDVHGHS
jgi:arabinofuranan 3-O-arabinosyltransferase